MSTLMVRYRAHRDATRRRQAIARAISEIPSRAVRAELTDLTIR